MPWARLMADAEPERCAAATALSTTRRASSVRSSHHKASASGQGFCVLAAVRVDTGQLHGSSHVLGDARGLAEAECG